MSHNYYVWISLLFHICKPLEFPYTIPHLTLHAMLFLGKGEWLLEFITSLIFFHFPATISNWSHGFTTFSLTMNSSHFFVPMLRPLRTFNLVGEVLCLWCCKWTLMQLFPFIFLTLFSLKHISFKLHYNFLKHVWFLKHLTFLKFQVFQFAL